MKLDLQKRVYRLGSFSYFYKQKETSSRVYFRHHTRNGFKKADHLSYSSLIFL